MICGLAVAAWLVSVAASGAGAQQTQAPVEQAGDGPPWLLMAGAAAGGALFVTLLLVLQDRRTRRRTPDRVTARMDEEWPWVKTDQAAATEVGRPADDRPREPMVDVAEASSVPRRRFDRDTEAPNGRAAASRRGPICQVRWSSAAACFVAVTTEADGVERRLAQSPTFEWEGPEPPGEESREARAALRVLSKELRDDGWRPMRVKGRDFDEQRWYARRFRLPVAEVDAPPSDAARA